MALPETDASSPTSEELDRLFAEIKKKDFTEKASIFKALGHPIRLKIVYGLVKVGGCNVKNMQACLGLNQATVSQHLIHLKSRGVIQSTRQGLEMIYSVTNPVAQCIIETIEEQEKEEAEKVKAVG
jgi:ArsR family transcriptional regulator